MSTGEGTRTGSGTLLAFALRRDRVRLPVWVAGGAVLMAVQSTGNQAVFGTPAELAAFRATIGSNAAAIALGGPPVGLDTIGGVVAFRSSFVFTLVAALMAMTTVVRHTRADEEAGRTELVRATRVGRHAPLLAAVALSALGCVALALGLGVAAAVTGLPAGGAFLFGASIGALGLVFTGVAAVAAQVTGSARAALGLTGTVFGIAAVLRAVGDIEGNGWSWASPIGWSQAAHPWSDDRWTPLLLSLAAAVVLPVVARALLDHRDLGAGLLQPRPGRPTATRALGSPLGLAWRLQRGALAGWAVGLVVLGLVYGWFAGSVEDLLAGNAAIRQFLPSSADLVDSYLATTLSITALLAGAYAVAAALRARGEEASGRAEPVLATATGRVRWLASHLAVALAGSAALLVVGGAAMGLAAAAAVGDGALAGRLVGGALAYVPAVWVLAGAAAALFGLLPRAAAALAWAAVAYVVVVTLFAESFDWPRWVSDASPLAWTPSVPAEAATAGSALGLLAVAAVLLAAGSAGFRRRDLLTE
ncbi:ABC transporter permease [Geodermatophilus sp. TF02-6]|uniref:ABC transporter permease n=1 Tax=Geodermatophilus sp. TF02-6 TaxID=2250575 RepID=UPI000DEBF8DF|nr:ABC transporter permease [Geodermatophilus sp. TF02-6]RBY75542.1 ABC transporter permease [Geodermatophilus sp. TF02-6]